MNLQYSKTLKIAIIIQNHVYCPQNEKSKGVETLLTIAATYITFYYYIKLFIPLVNFVLFLTHEWKVDWMNWGLCWILLHVSFMYVTFSEET